MMKIMLDIVFLKVLLISLFLRQIELYRDPFLLFGIFLIIYNVFVKLFVVNNSVLKLFVHLDHRLWLLIHCSHTLHLTMCDLKIYVYI